MNDTDDLKNFHYFCCNNEIFKVHTNNLQEAVVKRMKQQIENEEVVVRLIDYNRCVKQQDKQQIMKNQDLLKRKRVRSHLLQLFNSPIDDIDCDLLPDKKRKCLNKMKDKQLCYAIVDILDDVILEDAKLEPKLENFDNYQNEIVTINTEIGNLIDYKCVKKLNKPIILRAITNFQQIKNEPIDFNENIPDNIQNNDNNIDNSNDNEAVINQRLPVETFTTTETTINNRIVDNNDNNNNTNDRISDYILIIYEYLRDYLRILHQMNILNRLFSQIFKQYACNLTKELVQMLNQCRYILGKEFMKCIVSFQVQQLQTFNIDDIFNKLLELLKKDNINIEKYKFFCHIYQFLKPHQESIYNVNLLKIIYDEIEKFLKESDAERIRQLQQRANQPTKQNNVINEPRYAVQQQQTNSVTRQQENVVNEQQQQQQENLLNQERPTIQISLRHQQLQQQQSNSLNQQRNPAQTSLNQQQQQEESVLHQTSSMTRQQQQENVVNQSQYVTQSLLNHHQEQGGVLHQARSVTRQQQQQQQENVVNQSQYVTQSLLNQQQQKQEEFATRISLNHQQLQQQQQNNLINQQRSAAQATLNPQQQQQQKQQENDQRSVILIPLNHQNLQYQQQQKQQENALNQQKIIIETFLSYQHYQQVLLQQQQQQQQNNPLNQQRSIIQASLNHQQQENVLNEQRSVVRTLLSHQLQQQQDNGLNEQQQQQQKQQENGLNLQKSTTTRTTLSHQQILQQQQQNGLNQQRSVIQAPLNHQKQQQYRQENQLNLEKSVSETSLLKQQLNQPKFLEAFLNFHQLTQKQQYQQQMSGLHQTRSVTRQQQASKSKQKNSSVIQQTTSKCFQQQTHKSIYEKQQYSSNNVPINLSNSSNCFVASLSNRQLKPQSQQPQPQVETPIVFTQIQLAMLEEQIKDYHKLVQFKELMKNNNQQLQNNTSQVQQNQPSVIVTSSSTHQFVNNLGNIIRKVDGNIANSNHNRSIKQINEQLSKQQFNNSTISRNSALSKVQMASSSVLSSQQQHEQPTVLSELSPISTTTTTTVLNSTTPIREVVKSSTTETTTSTSSELCRESLGISPLPTSLSDSLFSSIPPPIPTTTENTTCLPTLTLILTTPTTTLTSSKSTPIVTTKIEPELVENPTIEDKSDAIVETVSSSIQTKQKSESSTSIILPSSVENNEKTIELLQSSIHTKQETTSRSSSPTTVPLLETIGNGSIKLLQSFEIKTEDCKEIDNLNYEYDGFGDDTTIKLNDYINIDDLYKHIKIEKKDIGGVSPSDSGLGSPFDMEMADLLHSNNDDVQIISDCISGQNEESSICLCGKKALYLCACRYSMYCSETCRLIDWKCHKSLCLRTIR